MEGEDRPVGVPVPEAPVYASPLNISSSGLLKSFAIPATRRKCCLLRILLWISPDHLGL
jgi:hypothetical protein